MKTRILLPALVAAGLAMPPLAPAVLSMELVRPLEEPSQSSAPKKVTKKSNTSQKKVSNKNKTESVSTSGDKK